MLSESISKISGAQARLGMVIGFLVQKLETMKYPSKAGTQCNYKKEQKSSLYMNGVTSKIYC
jgi:hypothetical protein